MKRPFIYLIRKRALGDVLWIEPVIRQLAGRYKKVIVHTKYNELFENYPLPNVVFRQKLSLLEKIIWKIESFLHISFFFINLENAYENNSRMHFLNAFQQNAGLPLTQEYPRLYLSEAENKKVFLPEKYVTMHVESFSDKNYRKVYGVEWDKIAAYLAGKGFAIVQLGKHPVEIANTRHISTSIRDMIALIKKSSFFIGIDSGPSHIAASLGVPSLVFFGAINPDYRHFRNLFKGHILQQACEFAGCYHDTRNRQEVDCRLVENSGIPKCSLHTTEYVTSSIDSLTKEYAIT